MLAKFMGVRAAEIFFEPLQLYLELVDLLEQLSFLGLTLAAIPRSNVTGEQLTAVIQDQPLPLANLDGDISGDLQDLATTDRLHCDPGLELKDVGASLTPW